MLSKKSSKLSLSEKVGRGKYDTQIIELFVNNNLDLMDFVSGPFRGKRSVYACLAFHLTLDWKDQEILRELYNILVYNKRSIRDRISHRQEELNLPLVKGKLSELEFRKLFDEFDDVDQTTESPINIPTDSGSKSHTNRTSNAKDFPSKDLNDRTFNENDSTNKAQTERTSILHDGSKRSSGQHKSRSHRLSDSKDPVNKNETDKNSQLTATNSDKNPKQASSKSADLVNQVIPEEDFETNSFDAAKLDINKTSVTELGENTFVDIPKRRFSSNVKRIEEIKRFMKENCQDEEIEKEIEKCRNKLANSNIKYKIETHRVYAKLKARIDTEIEESDKLCDVSISLRSNVQGLLHRLKEIIKG